VFDCGSCVVLLSGCGLWLPAQAGSRFATHDQEKCAMANILASMQALFGGYVEWWQLALVPVLIGLIWFLIWNKKRQM